MSTITEKTVKRLFALSGNYCAFPGCTTRIVQPTGTITGDICHIKARSKKGPRFDPMLKAADRDAYENLILLCKIHHTIIDGEWEKYPISKLCGYKRNQECDGKSELGIEEARHAFALYTNYVIHAKKVTLRTAPRTKIEIKPDVHPDSIAANLNMSRYVKHLIKRYQECQKWDSSKQGRRKYFGIYQAIQREFGSQWQDIPQKQFDALAAYLRGRISDTKLGKVTPHDLFDSFEGYLRKYGGKQT